MRLDTQLQDEGLTLFSRRKSKSVLFQIGLGCALVCSGCHNKIPEINFLTVSEAESLRSGGQRGCFLANSSLPGLWMAIFLLCPCMVEKMREQACSLVSLLLLLFLLLTLLLFKDFTYLFLERGEGRDTDRWRDIDVREKHGSVDSCMRLDWGPNPQPRHVY